MSLGTKRAFLTFVLTLAFLPAVSAQTAVGTIDGIVRDPDKQPVPGVTVTANGPALPQKDLTVVTSSGGSYRLPLLPPGTYTVTYVLSGFETVVRSGLIVSAGKTTTVDVGLTIGSISESVTVSGASPTVDSESAQLAFNYSQDLLLNVPTNRSQLSNMFAQIPGVESATPWGTSPGNLQKENVLGAGGFSNRYTMEGTSITDPSISFNVAALFSPDAIEEVQVIRGAKPAEVGFSSGGFFQIITKSGSNKFSGIGMLLWQGQQLSGNNISTTLANFGIHQGNLLKKDIDGSANLGGPLIRDKLFWYGSFRGDDKTNHLLGFAPDVQDNIRASFVKLTYQLNKSNRFSGFASKTTEGVNYFFFAATPALAAGPNATKVRDLRFDMVQAHWDSTLSPNVVAQAGFSWTAMQFNQLFQPDATIAVVDAVTGVYSGASSTGSRYSPAHNLDYDATLSWYVPDFAGRHELKFGAEYTTAIYPWDYDQIGDYYLGTVRGTPSTVTILSTPAGPVWGLDYTSLFAQDAWTLASLTLNLGIRYDHTGSKLPAQSSGGGAFANTSLAAQYPVLNFHSFSARDLWTFNTFAPRLAASYKVGRDGKTVIRGSYSRYYGQLNAQEVWNVDPNFPTYLTFAWNDLNNDGLFELGEQGSILSISGGTATAFDPNIKSPYSDEFTLAFSRQVAADFSVDIDYVHRVDKRLLSTISSLPFSDYSPVQITNPLTNAPMTVYSQDPATLGTATARLTNPTQAQIGIDPGRRYDGLEFIASKRLSNHWQVVGSFVYQRNEVAIPTSDSTGALDTFFMTPNSLINIRGLDDSSMTYQAKVQGTYVAPHGVVLSGFYRYGSGLPYTAVLAVTGLPQRTITVFAEPRGSRTTDSFNWLDLRAEKTFALPRANTKIGVFIDVFNVTNAATVYQYGSTVGVNLGVPQAVSNPRAARLGLRLGW
jgi:hypothetical protein